MRKIKLIFVLLAAVALGGMSFASSLPSTNPDLEVLAKDLTQHLADKQFAEVEKHFDGDMTSAVPTATLAQTWSAILGQVGAFQSIVATIPKEEEGYQIVLVTTKFEKTSLYLKWVFDKKNLVTGFFLVPVEPPPHLEAVAKDLTQRLADKQFADVEKHFDQTMMTAMPTSKLAQTWDMLIAQLGTLQSVGTTVVQEQEGHRIVLVKTKFEKTSVNLKWVFDSEGRVAGFFVTPV